MKEHPILFSGPMVRAILEGRKTQTRRVMKLNMDGGVYSEPRCPDGVPGDRLWVRETWADVRWMQEPEHFPNGVSYRADCSADSLKLAEHYGVRWKPSIHMPRWASRITLEVTEVRAQRLQDITEEDARAEGVNCAVGGFITTNPVNAFHGLWDYINGKRAPWDSNPWVWAVTFRRVDHE